MIIASSILVLFLPASSVLLLPPPALESTMQPDCASIAFTCCSMIAEHSFFIVHGPHSPLENILCRQPSVEDSPSTGEDPDTPDNVFMCTIVLRTTVIIFMFAVFSFHYF